MVYRIKELRKKKNMTQVALSEKSGITRATLWRLETGEEEVTTTTKTLGKIAEALEVPVDALFSAHNA